MRSLLAALTACSGFLTPALGAQRTAAQAPAEQPVSTIAARARPFVVIIRTYGQANSPVALGSGFVGPDGRVITNAHVLAGAKRVEISDADGRLLLTTTFAEALSTGADLAVLSQVPNRTRGLRVARVAPPTGEHIVVIGAPEGLSYTVTDGIVSGMRNLQSHQWLQISAPISHGSSGGPVLNLLGQVVGVSVAFLQEGQNLNFAVPAADVQALLRSPRGRVPFPVAESVVAAGSGEAPRVSGYLPMPPVTQSVQQFQIRLRGCVTDQGGRVGCYLDVTNHGGRAGGSQLLYLQDVQFVSEHGMRVVPTDMQLGSQQADDIAGLIVSDTIAPGDDEPLVLVFDQLPLSETMGTLFISAAAGPGSVGKSLSFRDVSIQH